MVILIYRKKYMNTQYVNQTERITFIPQLQDRKFEIENMMDAIFKGVFLKRYR